MSTHAGADGGPDPQRWRALAVCLVAGFMTLLDISIVNVALPAIEEGTNASTSDLQWIVSGYALTFGLVLVPAGRLGDVRSRRLMFAIGVAVFTLSSVGAGLAPTSLVLVIARLAQGVGGGLLNPQVSGLIQEEFRGAERGKAFGMLAATIGISTAVGPLLGGVIIDLLGEEHGWRWIFFVNVPIGIVCIALALRWVPEHVGGRRHEDLDLVGVLLLGAGVFSVLLPLVQQRQWSGPGKWWLLLLGALLLGAFVQWERRQLRHGRHPLVDLRLFSIETYSAGTAIAFLYFSGFTSIFFIVTIYLQSGMRYSALLAGLSVTPFAVGSAVTALVGGRVVSRIGRPLVVLGLVLVVVGLVAADVLVGWHGDEHRIGWWLAVPLGVAGLGSGLVISPNLTLTVSEVPVPQAGTASGVMQTGQRMATAAGIALIGSVFFGTLASSHDPAAALNDGLRVTVVIVAVALVAGVIDVWATRRREAR
ncbi:MAG TPA: MFS transporter [Actinomycetales bacterium]|nr:MFS transporter [Actinomycetales bacterium]